MFYLALRHGTIKITSRGSLVPGNSTHVSQKHFFPGHEFCLCISFKGRFPRIKSPETTHSKKIKRKKKSLKAIYKRTAISNNAHCNGLLHSKNISSKFVKVSSDPRINLRGGTWHSFVNHISSIEVPFEVIIPWDFIQLFLADLR